MLASSSRVVAAIVVGAFVLGPPEPAGALRTAPAVGARLDAVAVSQATKLEHPILVALNRIRKEHGLRPLRGAPRLVRAARAHLRALALAGQFRHEWPDGRPLDVWIRRFYPVAGARVWMVGETLIWDSGDLTPQRVTQAWLASPPHRHVLLMPSWRRLGIGAVRATGARGVYAGADVMIVAAEFGVRS